MLRDELLWRMAERAWEHHYCPSGATKRYCEDCQRDRSSSGHVECAELRGGFKRGPYGMEWKHAAEGALLALEDALGITIAAGDQAPTAAGASLPSAERSEDVNGQRQSCAPDASKASQQA